MIKTKENIEFLVKSCSKCELYLLLYCKTISINRVWPVIIVFCFLNTLIRCPLIFTENFPGRAALFLKYLPGITAEFPLILT